MSMFISTAQEGFDCTMQPLRLGQPEAPWTYPNERSGAGTCRGAHADEAARHSKLQRVLLRKQRHDARVDGRARHAPLRILLDDARPHLHLLPHTQHALPRPRLPYQSPAAHGARFPPASKLIFNVC